MDKKKQNECNVTVTFNGRKYSLQDWAEKETAANKDRSLDWSRSFPEKQDTMNKQDTDTGLFPRHKDKKSKKKKRGRKGAADPVSILVRLWLPVLAAVVIGLASGMTMLMFFSGADKPAGQSWAQSDGDASVQEQQRLPTRKDLEFSTGMIQAGVFSTMEKASQVAESLRNEGIPSLAFPDRMNTVFIGAASTVQSAKVLTNDYKEKGVSFYTRKYDYRVTDQSSVLKSKSMAVFAARAKVYLQGMHQIADLKADERYPNQQLMERLNRQLNTLKGMEKTDLSRTFLETAEATMRTLHIFAEKKDEATYYAFQQHLLELSASYQKIIGFEKK
ncbi:hypothetical protein [Sporolactobacillus sp. THM19-2]|uniref:hypothetical protein n=1 Tax=Sporolactobacillus sp. THM19-2 TaxID=2511171 RepID=UPI00101F9146|nr:hypothetical protein [Sporolactobacillus sp. THM19-2]RYL94680.1 hypothetical protein EWH91_01455 [Sporolactobacillus sp. THM19-2]